MSIVRLSSQRCAVSIDPQRGAHILSLTWKGQGGEFDILRPGPQTGSTQGTGCFVMAPFANRIDKGQFPFADSLVSIGMNQPEIGMNQPETGLALHGFSRDAAWTVEELTSTSVRMRTAFASASNPYHYDLSQTVSLVGHGIVVTLDLVNTGPDPLPFGMGLHPWFTKEPGTVLTLVAETQFDRNLRGFAENPHPMSSTEGFAKGLDVSKIGLLDRHFSGWRSALATIDWPQRNLRLTITASGAFSNLHLYVPDNQPVFCVEPVSHVPDVHNRREFAPHGDYRVLAQGETMSGTMTLQLA